MESVAMGMNPADEAMLAAVIGDGASPVVHTRSFTTMGSNANVTIVGGHPSLADDAVGLAAELEGLWTRFSPDSDISALNWSEGKPVEVDPRTVDLIDMMQRAHRDTSGAFDPTLLPALMRQGYTHSLVDPSRVTTLPASAVAPGRLGEIHVEGTVVTMPIGTTLDAGGIGKGYAADLISDYLRGQGVLGAMVELGGDLRVQGFSPRGRGWRLGVENPVAQGSHVSVIEIESGGLATSSQLKRRFVSDEGRDGHHLIDAQSSSSIDSQVLSVTVLAPSAWEAEVLAKVGFLRSPAEFLTLARRRGVKVGVFTNDGAWTRSSDWPEYRA